MNRDIPPVESIPRDLEGPVFREPWEAQAFALVVELHRAGAFEWKEWAEVLSREIAHAKADGDPDRGDRYYHHWLHALEDLIADKHLATEAQLAERREEIQRNPPSRHDHVARRAPVHVSRSA